MRRGPPQRTDPQAEVTRKIAEFAQAKQLESAKAAFATIEADGLKPNGYAFSAIINAHVTSGDLEGATMMLRRMEASGIAPNLIVFTTLLKGHCIDGDLQAARQLLENMIRASPPIRPDARALNTFMRGCVRVGDLAAARWAFGKLGEWRLTPSEPAIVAYGRLLSQGLRLGALRRTLQAQAEGGGAAAAQKPRATANRCTFWERGRCERGAQCHFYHDPAIVQSDAAQVEAARRDARLELTVQLAHAAALLGRPKACRKALATADELQRAADAAEHTQQSGCRASCPRGCSCG